MVWHLIWRPQVGINVNVKNSLPLAQHKLRFIAASLHILKFKYFMQPNHDNLIIILYSSNYALYGDMSDRLMKVLSEFTHDVEIYSIDEAFLQFKGYEHFNLEKLAFKIKKTVACNLGLPISIGIDLTKVLAKVAKRIAKKFSKKTNDI